MKTYNGECIPLLCTINVHVEYDVVAGDRPNLMGKDWLCKLKVTVANIHSLASQTTLNDVLDRHSSVFLEGVYCLKEVKGLMTKLFLDF